MHVLVVGSEKFTTRPGGLNRYLADLNDALLESGIETTTLFPGERFRDSALPAPLKTAARVVAVTVDALRLSRRCDVVDLHFALYALGPVVVARWRRIPVVVHFQGPWAEESAVAGVGSPLARKAKARVERFVYSRADALVVLCEAFAERLVRDYGVDRARVRVTPPGVDLERFTRRTDIGKQPRPTAVAARRLDPRMGLDTAVAAWARVVSEIPAAELVIAGEGRSRPDLERQIAALGLAGSVSLEGRVTDARLLELYRTAHITLVPTRALEGFGLVALESLAVGTPVVVTDVDALPEYIGRLDPSMVVPRDDPAALGARAVSALRGAAPAPEDCVEFAEQFTWARAAADHADLYRSLVPPRHQGSTVAVLALEWPTRANSGGGVARHNWRVAHELARAGHRVVVVTGPDALDSPAVELRHVRVRPGRFARYYVAPVRAARVIRRASAGAVVASGDDWALLGTPRSRIYHGTARSEARHSTGVRRLNHQLLRALEFLGSLDPAARAYAVGPDVPRRRMRARDLPPVSGLEISPGAGDVRPAERHGVVFIGPHAGRKRGSLAEDVVAGLRAAGLWTSLTVFTSRAEDAPAWSGDADVHVAAPDDEIRAALGHAKFLLCTSSYEGFGIPTVEALAAGCLPVATATPGAVGVLTGDLASLLGPTDPRDFVRFAVARMVELDHDDQGYAALQQAGLDRAGELLVAGAAARLVPDRSPRG